MFGKWAYRVFMIGSVLYIAGYLLGYAIYLYTGTMPPDNDLMFWKGMAWMGIGLLWEVSYKMEERDGRP